jgi:hypothetical protein
MRLAKVETVPLQIKPLQIAQVVWRRALELTDPLVPRDPLAGMLEVLRAASHDVTTVAHALTLGRTQVREHPTDLLARLGTGLLERALAFMGATPRAGER